MTRALQLLLLAECRNCAGRRGRTAAVDQPELPAGRCRRPVHGAGPADRSPAERHFRPRLSAHLPRCRGTGRQRRSQCGEPLDLAREPSALSAGVVACNAEEVATIDNVGAVRALHCRDEAAGIDYRRYAVQRGNTSYLAEGLAGYDPALRLALASVVTDRAQSGAVQVATTEVSDPAAFARVQAGALDPAGARTEAYIRNNAGRFAESAEFFESLAGRSGSEPAVARRSARQPGAAAIQPRQFRRGRTAARPRRGGQPARATE